MPELEAHTSNSKSVASLLSEADLSPMPSPDYDAPSPEPDDAETELKLPGDDLNDLNVEPVSPPTPTEEGLSTPPPMGVPTGVPPPVSTLPPEETTPRAPSSKFKTSNWEEIPGLGSNDQISISEYLTKLAGQDKAGPEDSQNNGFFYEDSGYIADPPPATSWPAPKSDFQPANSDFQPEKSDFQPDWQHQMDNPIPEWQLEPEDDEPPEIVEENLAMARLQSRNNADKNLVQVRGNIDF